MENITARRDMRFVFW